MILHCKNAEMTILSFLHFNSVKSYNFYSFFNILIFFFKSGSFFASEKIKKVKNIFFFSKMQKFGSEDP